MNCESYSYRNLSSSGCFRPSPASCMSNYGRRSVMDNMNFVEYVENSNTGKSTAVPAATGTIKMQVPPRPLERYDPLTEQSDGRVFRPGAHHFLQSAPLVDNRYERSVRAGRRLLGTQELAPGF